jgi:dUTP pyrophosphatase
MNRETPLVTLWMRPADRPGERAPAPRAMSAGAAGLDLCADVAEPLVLAPGARALVPTGWHVAVPEGFEGQVRPRSGLALKHGVTVLNAPGTIDSDYRGEVGVVLINHGSATFEVRHGERIAQLVVGPVARVEASVTSVLDETGRGQGGFGSTGR